MNEAAKPRIPNSETSKYLAIKMIAAKLAMRDKISESDSEKKLERVLLFKRDNFPSSFYEPEFWILIVP